VEAVILAGGKAERLGEAAGGRPKALVDVAGRPLAAYQVDQLAAAGVERVLVSCAAGQESTFEAALGGIGPEIVTVPEREPLGRGGGIRLAAARRREEGDFYALNGDELVDVSLPGLLALHREERAAATITVVPLRSPFGVVDLDETRVTGFREAPRLDQWVSARTLPRARRPRDDDLSATRRGRAAARAAARGRLADRQHAEGSARGDRLPAGASGLAGGLACVIAQW
jgi:mannose-1-phosphate guanylyltransferase